MPIIETKNLYKTYKDEMSEVHAVDDVNISISEGEFTAIVGPSGSGKTTLLNLIGGLDTPTSGNLYIDGQDISLLKPKEMVDFRLHNIGFVFQSFNLIPVLSAKENVAFVMELQGRKKKRTGRACPRIAGIRRFGRSRQQPPLQAFRGTTATRGSSPRAGIKTQIHPRRRTDSKLG